MKYTILMGSPRRDGNTAALLRPFMEENQGLGIEQEIIWLYERNIQPCLGCKNCQNKEDYLGCIHEDDVQEIFNAIQNSDVLIFATPIYSWFCTPPMKAVMDRLIYGGCKYYGAEKQPSIYKMKKIATITTCGYAPNKGTDLWEEGLKRWCKHGNMKYLEMFCHRDMGKQAEFMTEQVELDIRNFAHTLYGMIEDSL